MNVYVKIIRTHSDDVSTDEEREFLGEEIGEVHKRWPVSWVTGQHQHLGPVVLDVVLGVRQALHSLQGVDEHLGLSGAAPVGLGLPVADVQVEDSHNDESGEGGVPLDQKHHGDAQDGAQEGNPGTVEFQVQSHLTHLLRFCSGSKSLYICK